MTTPAERLLAEVNDLRVALKSLLHPLDTVSHNMMRDHREQAQARADIWRIRETVQAALRKVHQ